MTKIKYLCVNLFLVLCVQLFSFVSKAQSCSKTSQSVTDQVQGALSDLYEPSNLVGSCAVEKQQSELANWRKTLAKDVETFTNQDFRNEVLDGLKAEKLQMNRAREDDPQWSAKNKECLANPENKKCKTEFAELNSRMNAAFLSKNQQELKAKMTGPFFRKVLKNTAANRLCTKGVSFDFLQEAGIRPQTYNPKIPSTRSAAFKEITNDIKDFESSTSPATVCTKPVEKSSQLVDVQTTESINLQGSDFFDDNKVTLSPEKLDSLNAKINALSSKLPKNCSYKITSIDIATSANLKANSDEIGRWDFLKLSQLRAEYIKGKVLENLQAKIANKQMTTDQADLDKLLNLDFSGTNGNGTSGPCPYKVTPKNNNTYKIEPDSKVWSSKGMDSSKYAKIDLGLEKVGPGCDESPKAKVDENTKHYFATKCYFADVTCKK